MEKSVYEGINRVIDPSKTHFVSEEGAKHYKIPTFNTKDKDGEPVTYAAYQGEYYKLQRTITPFPEPIEFSVSGRK